MSLTITDGPQDLGTRVHWNADALILNDPSMWASDGYWYKVLSVDGFADRFEETDNRAPRTARIGEQVSPPQVLGKTLVYSVEIRAKTYQLLTKARNRARAAFSLTREASMLHEPTVTGPSWSFNCKPMQAQFPKSLERVEGQNDWRATGQIAVRMSDPRFLAYSDPVSITGSSNTAAVGRYDDTTDHAIPQNDSDNYAPTGGETVLLIPFVVGDIGTVSKVTCSFYIEHPYPNDLRLDLIAPDARQVNILNHLIGSGTPHGLGIGTADADRVKVDDDSTSGSLDFADQPAVGTWTPVEDAGTSTTGLSKLAGMDAAGTWYLRVYDWNPTNAGTVHAASLIFNDASGGGTSGTASVGVTNEGTAPADPVITVAGVDSGDTLTLTDDHGHTLILSDLPSAGDLVVNFAERTIEIGGTDVSAAFNYSSDWWDKDVPGLPPGATTVTASALSGAIDSVKVEFWPTSW